MGQRRETLQNSVYPLARVYKRAGVRSRALFLFSRLTGSVRRQGDYNETRKVFTRLAKSPLDWPEMIWEAWLSFEHSHGSAKEVQNALDVVERARVQVEARRAKVVLVSFLEPLTLS